MLDVLRYADAAAARREHPRRRCEQGLPLAIGDYGCVWLETVPMVMPMTGREENAFLGNAEVVVRDTVVRATAISGGEALGSAMASAGGAAGPASLPRRAEHAARRMVQYAPSISLALVVYPAPRQDLPQRRTPASIHGLGCGSRITTAVSDDRSAAKASSLGSTSRHCDHMRDRSSPCAARPLTGRGPSVRSTLASGLACRLSHQAGSPSAQPFIAIVTRLATILKVAEDDGMFPAGAASSGR